MAIKATWNQTGLKIKHSLSVRIGNFLIYTALTLVGKNFGRIKILLQRRNEAVHCADTIYILRSDRIGDAVVSRAPILEFAKKYNTVVVTSEVNDWVFEGSIKTISIRSLFGYDIPLLIDLVGSKKLIKEIKSKNRIKYMASYNRGINSFAYDYITRDFPSYMSRDHYAASVMRLLISVPVFFILRSRRENNSLIKYRSINHSQMLMHHHSSNDAAYDLVLLSGGHPEYRAIGFQNAREIASLFIGNTLIVPDPDNSKCGLIEKFSRYDYLQNCYTLPFVYDLIRGSRLVVGFEGGAMHYLEDRMNSLVIFSNASYERWRSLSIRGSQAGFSREIAPKIRLNIFKSNGIVFSYLFVDLFCVPCGNSPCSDRICRATINNEILLQAINLTLEYCNEKKNYHISA